ncbi:MAG: precorrin-4 C(11)-methyltransferase [Treponema sp.]|nr:precorrin-4 C(11)-methyltransferase [Treponema sp.]
MIYFVGAGSGAADLITVRGMRLLEQADVVVWAGSLVNGELLSYCKPTCEIHDSARLTLEETDAILQKASREGKNCVRLHTGDPAIYGAIREQMELLDKAGISYEVVPGVSSMFAAAASLKKEFTVPGVSQTVIVSRMEGRTPVPEREKIRSLSAHGATMVLFLSSGMIPDLVRELLAGGAYTKDTPCAVVYKASWADEKIVRGSLSDIAEKAAEAGIAKTALVLVGDFLGDRYEMSRLYDKHFSTEYRKGNTDAQLTEGVQINHFLYAHERSEYGHGLTRMGHGLFGDACGFVGSGRDEDLCASGGNSVITLDFDSVSLVCFSEKGAGVAEKIADGIRLSLEKNSPSLTDESVTVFRCFGERHSGLHEFCEEQFAHAHGGKRTLIVFVGACGIAVRGIAPFVQSKATDPAVVSVDEVGQFVIPLLSGHLGGANDAARAISSLLGAIPVVTTATDVRGAWAIDSWAKAHDWKIPDLQAAKKISAAVLAGKKVLVLGIGCKRGTDSRALSDFVRAVCAENCLPLSLVGMVASIDIKKDERALTDIAAELCVPFVTFTADELNAADAGESCFSSSDFVRDTTGTDCVCERAAVRAVETTADWLLVRKVARDGMTVAVVVSA